MKRKISFTEKEWVAIAETVHYASHWHHVLDWAEGSHAQLGRSAEARERVRTYRIRGKMFDRALKKVKKEENHEYEKTINSSSQSIGRQNKRSRPHRVKTRVRAQRKS